MKKALLAIAIVVGLLAQTLPGSAHALQPGYLELRDLGNDTWRVFWRKPDVKGVPMALDARLSAACSPINGPQSVFDGAAWVSQWITRCPGGLQGVAIFIDGLSATKTDVLVRYELQSGRGQAQRLTPEEPSFVVPKAPGAWEVLKSYFSLGLDHILEGYDHLLFVFALLLLIGDVRKLIGAITAFTLAHSITLAAAAIGWLHVPGPPVEAIIALSIMFVASEVLAKGSGRSHLSERAPWIVSFGFGLLHGLGFGSALLEIGLPATEITLALFAFNVGVEAGQLLFILAVFLLVAALRRLVPALMTPTSAFYRTTTLAMPFAVGGLAAFWFIERLSAF